MNGPMLYSGPSVWKPVLAIAGGITALGAAWAYGVPLIASTFLATDGEVVVAVDVVDKARLAHEAEVKPKFIEIAGALEIVTKQQAQAQLQFARNSVARDEALLFDVQERRKVDPSNPDTLARERTLMRNVNNGRDDMRRAKCQVLKLNGQPC